MNKPNCFVAQIDLALAPKLEADLKDQGFELGAPVYTIFQAKKKGVSCTLYQSGKLTVQGKEKEEFITFYLEPEILGNLSYSYPTLDIDQTPHIGVDEAGKGDLFGPLCIGAVYADEAGIEKLIQMGIRDSKRMQDSTILKLAKQIRETYLYTTIKIFPAKYNELYERFRNLNSLLGWAHAAAIETLHQKSGAKKATIDQFAGEHVVLSALEKKEVEVELTQRHKGEEDPVVAAASIIARAAFVEGIDKLSEEHQVHLPKGASNLVVEAGRKFVARHGRENLSEVAKMHFKTIDKILLG